MIIANSAKKFIEVNTYVHLFLCLALCANVSAQNAEGYAISPGIASTYQHILKLKMLKAKTSLDSIKNSEKASPLWYYSENLLAIINVLLEETEPLYKKQLKLTKLRLNKVGDLPADNPYKRFVLAEIKMSWAFLKLKFGDSFSVGWDIKQANKLITENEKEFPDFLPNLKSRAVLNLLIGAVPSKYNWVLDLVGLSGNTDLGLKQLQKLEESNHFLGLEASIVRCLSGVYLLNDETLFNSFLRVYEEEKDNLLVKFAYAAICIKSHKSEQALAAIQSAEKLTNGYAKLHYLKLMKGKIMLQKKNYALALLYTDQFLANYKGRNNIKEASFQFFLGYWLNNKDKKANMAFESAKTKGDAISTGDKYVNNLLVNNDLPHKAIMQIRLAIDGGYYDLASEELKRINPADLQREKTKTDFYYRKARLSHLINHTDSAIHLYQMVINASKDANWYFAPSAALQLGHIYFAKNELDTARYYYQMVTKFRKHPYKQSLDHQANALLTKLEDM